MVISVAILVRTRFAPHLARCTLYICACVPDQPVYGWLKCSRRIPTWGLRHVSESYSLRGTARKKTSAYTLACILSQCGAPGVPPANNKCCSLLTEVISRSFPAILGKLLITQVAKTTPLALPGAELETKQQHLYDAARKGSQTRTSWCWAGRQAS